MEQKEYVGFGITIIVVFIIGYLLNTGSSEVKVLNVEERVQTTEGVGRILIDDTAIEISEILELKEDDHVRGNKDARIIVIEYSDFQCPFCARAHKTLIDLLEERDIAWVYRHLPFKSIDDPISSYAGICIAKEEGNDEFWTYTDDLFFNNSFSLRNDRELVRDIKEKYGFNTPIQECMKSESVKERVARDIRDGVKLGVGGTPGFYVVNLDTNKYRNIPGAAPLKDFIEVIERIGQ